MCDEKPRFTEEQVLILEALNELKFFIAGYLTLTPDPDISKPLITSSHQWALEEITEDLKNIRDLAWAEDD